MTIRILAVTAACLAALSAFLAGEMFFLEKKRRRIPLRIGVTGTRGKSSVARLTAAALRASGRSVLAKTTGSSPILIHPDGSEHEIRRQGPPRVLEGKTLLKTACRLGADTVVSELMSINPECLAVESCRLLKPSLLAVTNVRIDHRDVMGRSREDIARGLAESVLPGSTIFMLEENVHPAVAEKAGKVGAVLVPVPRRNGRLRSVSRSGSRRPWDFDENTRLALALASACGVDEKTALAAFSSVRPDPGAFRLWRIRAGESRRLWRCAAAFAANEPESTSVLLDRLRKDGLLKKAPRVALLNLRDDRPDRTLQWAAAAGRGYFREFDLLSVAGASRAAARLWKREAVRSGLSLFLIHTNDPAAVMNTVVERYRTGGFLFGAGNIGGLGRALIGHWERHGECCG
ncbi:MAG: poly-gamma-glutamate synthase PgsB [Candidatus Aminicenantes bacterium]|nr:poly-gamma-glutamate synthase PgsB [Candidatus Aminicenantes bacterium]